MTFDALRERHLDFIEHNFGGRFGHMKAQLREAKRYKAIEIGEKIMLDKTLTLEERKKRVEKLYKFFGVKSWHTDYLYNIYKEHKNGEL